MEKQLIFGIGLNKTGTNSLAQALRVLGYKCLHNAKRAKKIIEPRLDSPDPLGPLRDKYQAFCDSPFWMWFPQLYAAYPASKFIVTVRDVDSWLKSRIAHFGGSAASHMVRWDWVENRLTEVFGDKRDELLFYKLCDGEGWEPLCAYLGHDIPGEPFPWRNKTTPGKVRRRKLTRKHKRILSRGR